MKQQKRLLLILIGVIGLLSQLAEAQNVVVPKPECGCAFPLTWSKRTEECKKRPTCKRCAKIGKVNHPFTLCKCITTAEYAVLQGQRDTKYLMCTKDNNIVPTEKWARCGGRLRKCTMYQKYNWNQCRCERKEYCAQGCPAGKALHPGYNCKCVDFLDEAIPTQYLKEETDAGCGQEHYYNEDADFCVAYNWCPKWHECGSGREWSQEKCDCVASTGTGGGTRPEPEQPEPEQPEPEAERPTRPQPQPETEPAKPTGPIEVVKDCETDEFGIKYRWDSSLGYCIEVRGSKPECPQAKEWSDEESACVWKADGCDRVDCGNPLKRGRWYKGSCRCFTDKAWCKLQKCSGDRQGFSFGTGSSQQCRCYTLKENCMRRKCGLNKSPGFYNGRCSCYSDKAKCAKKTCPPGRSGYLTGDDNGCQCMTTQEQCSMLDCPSGQRGFFWNQKCKCQSQGWICSLKKCQANKSPSLFRGHCLCLWNQGFCDSKKCPQGMAGRWDKGSCRCYLTEKYCDRLKCTSDKEGHWADNWCRCFYKEADCENKTCPSNQFSAWFKDRCRCFAKLDKCTSTVCPQGKMSYFEEGEDCKCIADPTWKPPQGLCSKDQVWSKSAWGCIERETTCRSDQTWSSTKERCVRPNCSDLQRWSRDERRCICRVGTYWDDDVNTCQQIECGVGWIYSGDEGTCIVDVNYKAECPTNMKWSLERQSCVCNPGYYYSWKKSVCRPVNCGNIRKWSKAVGKCVTPSCNAGQVWRRGKGCHCEKGKYMSMRSKRCEFIPECTLGDMWSSSQQVCVEDPDYVGECQANARWNENTRACDCLSGYFFSKRERGCVKIDCRSDEKWSPRHTRCIPINCPEFMYWDDKEVECVCNDDRFFSPRKNRCVPIYCPDGEKFNFKLVECVKIAGWNPGSNPRPQPPTNRPEPEEEEEEEEEEEPVAPKPRPPVSKVTCRRPKVLDVSINKCVCRQEVAGSKIRCKKGRKVNTRFCRCSIRTKDCPRTKRCKSGFDWNNKAGVCKCEKNKFVSALEDTFGGFSWGRR